MKNIDLFVNGYDMVVALTIAGINDQIAALTNPVIGTINTSIIVAFQPIDIPPNSGPPSEPDPKSFKPYFYSDWSSVPAVDGSPSRAPLWTTLTGTFVPSISIAPSTSPDKPPKVVLLLTWQKGKFYQAKTGLSWPMDGWTWEVSVDLGIDVLTELPTQPTAIPTKVLLKLKEFFATPGNTAFTLFLDFAAGQSWSSNTAGEPEVTASTENHNAMITYFYYYELHPEANPYTLAYNITQASQVPASLVPIGCTYNFFYNADHPSLSTVNLIFNGSLPRPSVPTIAHPPGKGRNPYPGAAEENWMLPISPSADINGKIVYSAFSFMETLILQPYITADIPAPNLALWLGETVYDFQRLPTIGNTSVDSRLLNDRTNDPVNILAAHDDRMDWEHYVYAGLSSVNDTSIRLALDDRVGNFVSDGALGIYGFKVPFDTFDPQVMIDMTIGTSADRQVLNLALSNPPGEPPLVAMGLGRYCGTYVFQNMGKTLPTYTQDHIMLPAGDTFFAKKPTLLPGGHLSTEVTFKAPLGSAATGSELGDTKNVVAADVGIGKLRTLATSTDAVKGASKPVKQASDDSPSLGSPLADVLHLHGTDSTGTPLDLTISCELMHNCKTAMPITTGNFLAAQDATGNPLLCEVGTDRKLRMLVGHSGSNDSGWDIIEMMQKFTDIDTAGAFHMAQDSRNRISLAFAGYQGGKTTGPAVVYFASLLSNDLKTTDLSNLQNYALKIDGMDPAFQVDSIRIGSSVDDSRPLLTIEGSLNAVHALYQVSAASNTAEYLELPEDIPASQTLRAHVTGLILGLHANFFLFIDESSKEQQLIAKSSDPTTPRSWDFGPGIQGSPVSCFATLDDLVNTGYSDLYIAGAGVSRFPDCVLHKKETVAEVAIVGNVTAIWLASDDTTVSVWTLNTNSDLYYTRGLRDSTTSNISWNQSILFKSKASWVAPLRSTLHNTNELFVLDQQLKISHHWQDPTSTIWRSSVGAEQIGASSSGAVAEYDSFTTHIHCEQDGMPVHDFEVEITSSEWQYLTIYNVVYSITDTTSATARSDTMGNITIIMPATDIAPPIIHVTSARFTETLNIYPAGKIHNYLNANLKGVNSAVGQDGKPLVSGDVHPDVVDGVTQRASVVANVGDQDYPPSKEGHVFVSVEQPQKASKHGLKHTLMTPFPSEKLPDDFFLAVKFSHQTRQHHLWSKHEARAHVAQLRSSGLLGGFFDWVGDALHAIENAAESAFTAIKDVAIEVSDDISIVIQAAEEGLEFIMTIAGQVLQFAVKTFLQAFKAITTLLKLIGIDILRWLGHLLGWDKVWDTHNVIRALLQNLITFAQEQVPQYLDAAKNEMHKAFADLESIVSGDSAPTQVRPQSQQLLNSPQGNFGYYHLQNGVNSMQTSVQAALRHAQQQSRLQREAALVGDDAFATQFQSLVAPTAERLVSDLGDDAANLVNLIKSGSVTDLRKLLSSLLKTFLDPIEGLIDALADMLSSSLSSFANSLNHDLGMPVLAAVYTLVSGLMEDGDGEDFTILNGISFVMALIVVPMLEIYGNQQLYELDQNHGIGCTSPNMPGRLLTAIQSTMASSSTAKQSSALPSKFGGENPLPPDALKAYSHISSIAATVCNLCAKIVSLADMFDITAELNFVLLAGGTLLGFPMPTDGQETDIWAQRIALWAFGGLTDTLCNMPLSVSPSVYNSFENNRDSQGTPKRRKECTGMVQLFVRIPRLAFAIEIDAREHGDDVLVWFTDMFTQTGGVVSAISDVYETLYTKIGAIGLSAGGVAFAAGEHVADMEKVENGVKKMIGMQVIL